MEIALALFVLSVALLGTLAAASATAEGIERARRVSAAALAAQEEMEGWINRPFAAILPGSHDCSNPVSAGLPAGLVCSLNVEALPAGLKRITVAVSRQDGQVVHRLVGLVADGS